MPFSAQTNGAFWVSLGVKVFHLVHYHQMHTLLVLALSKQVGKGLQLTIQAEIGPLLANQKPFCGIFCAKKGCFLVLVRVKHFYVPFYFII